MQKHAETPAWPGSRSRRSSRQERRDWMWKCGKSMARLMAQRTSHCSSAQIFARRDRSRPKRAGAKRKAYVMRRMWRGGEGSSSRSRSKSLGPLSKALDRPPQSRRVGGRALGREPRTDGGTRHGLRAGAHGGRGEGCIWRPPQSRGSDAASRGS